MSRRTQRGRWWAWGVQVALLAALAALLWWFAGNAVEALRARGIQAGFDFLAQPAGFEIGEGPLETDATQPLWRAFLAGLLNTLRVALPAIVLTTVLGVLLGIGRLAPHRLLSSLCGAYVEAVRNVPLLVQLLMAYFLVTHFLPSADEAWQVGQGLFLSKSGLSFPWPMWAQEGSGLWPVWEWPEKSTFNVSGGAAVTPEYLAVCWALVTYTAAFVAEAVRAGIQAVPIGQRQAALSLGLRPLQALRWVVFPQALRIMVPSLTNQYLNLLKNSTLAVVVGYPDLVSVSNTVLNQTGRAFECIAILMAVYLSLSLVTSALMNVYNARVALRGVR
ncbi:MAG: ABC transporter permease subunit [Pseudomonadota bacterium]